MRKYMIFNFFGEVEGGDWTWGRGGQRQSCQTTLPKSTPETTNDENDVKWDQNDPLGAPRIKENEAQTGPPKGQVEPKESQKGAKRVPKEATRAKQAKK